MSISNNIIDRLLKARLLSHSAFWILMVLLLAYHGSLFGGNFRDNLVNMCVLLPVQMAAAYFLIYVQLPKLLFRGHWVIFLFTLTAVAYLLAAVARLTIIYIAEPIIGYDGYDESLWEVLSDPIYLVKVYMVSLYLPALLFFMIKMTKERFTQQHRVVELEKEKRSAELNFLKAQMNPHFLFNTLNNIYSLAKSKSDQTPEMILKLSEILDYTIYECQENLVPVSSEWQLIENYTDLQALRHNDELTVFIEQDIDDDEAQISPLILISLVENAFKHTKASSTHKASIKVHLSVLQNQLTLLVKNTKSSPAPTRKTPKKGIGFQNVKKQLDMLYPDRHTLEVNDQEQTYEVVLTIHL